MDGNISREGMTADLESMKAVGLGNLIFLDVDVGVPRGLVDFMSESCGRTYSPTQFVNLSVSALTSHSAPGPAGQAAEDHGANPNRQCNTCSSA